MNDTYALTLRCLDDGRARVLAVGLANDRNDGSKPLLERLGNEVSIGVEPQSERRGGLNDRILLFSRPALRDLDIVDGLVLGCAGGQRDLRQVGQ